MPSLPSADGGRAATRDDGPPAVWLHAPSAADAAVTGAKAAALATAAGAGLPIVRGFAITTAACERIAEGDDLPEGVTEAWRELSQDDRVALVVRSSSTVEDLGNSSMAGRFESVLDVRGLDGFRRAVDEVIASREQAAAGSDLLTGREPIAVLVQPLLDVDCGGVLFGIDPVSGREDRLVVAATEGGPDRLVSGQVDGDRYELDRRGRSVQVDRGDGGTRLSRGRLRALAALAARTAEVFGGPQDVEWAYERNGRLRLLQSRPVTAEPRGRPVGPVLGPGPVAETFPEPLQPLEVDLWVEPLRTALARTLLLTGTAPEGQVADSPVVAVVGGYVAVDLDLLEPKAGRTGLLRRLDPRPGMRRLHASWRVGRLRAALPALARDVLAAADAALADVPPLDDLDDAQLLGLLHRTGPSLVSVHAHELLVGLLVDPERPRTTGVGVALDVLARARQAGLPDERTVAEHPVVLALSPPQIRPSPLLPADVPPPPDREPVDADDPALLREALRLRTRWLQEVGVRAAWTLGVRLTAAGRLPHPEDVRGLRLSELEALVRDATATAAPERLEPGEPLPARFRMSDTGAPVVVAGGADAAGAGGGQGRGPVHHGDDPPEGAVLVVRTLDPSLASVLPRLAGLVAETGSVLAHLAILAREAGVPTVVGAAGALDRYAPGTVVRVDGDTGEIEEDPS